MTYLTLTFALRPSPTTFNLPNARLVTLAPGLRPERRFAPLARGLHKRLPYRNTTRCHIFTSKIWNKMLNKILLSVN